MRDRNIESKSAPEKRRRADTLDPRGPYKNLFPLIRQNLWGPDGKPREEWSERREGSVLKAMLQYRSVSQIEVAILGLAKLRDSGQVDWLKPGEKCSVLCLHHTRSGVYQMFELATTAYWREAKQAKPRPISSIGDILLHGIRQSDTYRAYLRSPEWRQARQRILSRAGLRCERCNSYGDGLDVHHLRYDNLGHEPDSDLEVLCWKCHKAADRERRGLPGMDRGAA